MGLDRLQKQRPAGSAGGPAADHDQDPGILHSAQVARQHGPAAKPTADTASAEAMNDALLRVAQGLHGALVQSQSLLKAGGTQVSIYNQNIQNEQEALDAVEKKYDERDNAHASDKTLDRLSHEIDDHRDTLSSARSQKKDYIAGIRERTFEPLLKDRVRELQDAAAEAQYFGWSTEQHQKVSTGANVLGTMLKQVHVLGKNLELDASPSLQALEKALADIVGSMKIVVGDTDPSELDKLDPRVLLQASVRDNLVAAEAQARNAYAAIHAWVGRTKSADFGHVQGSVQAVKWHLSDAVDLLGQLAPAERHAFKPMLHGLAKEVEAVHRIGRLHADGHAPAGSASMDIDAFPYALEELRKAIGG